MSPLRPPARAPQPCAVALPAWRVRRSGHGCFRPGSHLRSARRGPGGVSRHLSFDDRLELARRLIGCGSTPPAHVLDQMDAAARETEAQIGIAGVLLTLT